MNQALVIYPALGDRNNTGRQARLYPRSTRTTASISPGMSD